jgi:hypothetical protein
MPASQRAAIDAFCLEVDRAPEDLETEMRADAAYFVNKIIDTAKSEIEIGSPVALRRAVDRLEAILVAESFNDGLAEHYAKACYD